MITSRTRMLLLASALLLVSCGEGGPEQDAPAADAAGEATSSGEMAGMPGMDGQGDMMTGMGTAMQAMMSAGADSIAAMLPMHRQMLANMIAEANREMREMNMPGDAVWSATVDSLRSDLTRMPEMSGAELRTFMPEHGRRVMRLIEMHRAMMAGMGM